MKGSQLQAELTQYPGMGIESKVNYSTEDIPVSLTGGKNAADEINK